MISDSIHSLNSPEGSNPSLTAIVKNGDPNKTPTSERFWRQVDRTLENGCWPWLGYLDKDGYGRFTLNRKKYQTHRFAYFLATGQEPNGSHIRHSCDNPSCVNPAHLSAGSHVDNMHDRNARGRHAFGERNGRAKLTPDDVRSVLEWRNLKASFRSIGQRLGVNERVIRDIATGVSWNHVTGLPKRAGRKP